MAITGTGKVKRNSSMVFMEVETDEFEVVGKAIPDMAREMNNDVASAEDVLGNTETDVTKGAQVTSVEPQHFLRESKISQKMYEIYKEDKELDEVKFPFVEVFTEDEVTAGEYGAFKQIGAVDLKKWGGPAAAGLETPFDINWNGTKTHGTFNPTTKKFTPTV